MSELARLLYGAALVVLALVAVLGLVNAWGDAAVLAASTALSA